jgi:hypothetical protein
MIWWMVALLVVIGMLLAVVATENSRHDAVRAFPSKYANLTEAQALGLQQSYERTLCGGYQPQSVRDNAVVELSLLNVRIAELKREREDAEMVARYGSAEAKLYLPEIEERG